VKRTYYLVLVVAFLVTVWTVGLIKVGPAPTIIIGGSAALALVAWLLTTYKQPASQRIVPVYLLTVTFLHVHIMEEYVSGFPAAMSELFGLTNFTERPFLIGIAFVGPTIWILVGIGLIYKNSLANYLAWFIFIGPGFMEFTHYVFPIIEGGPYHYFPGMYTAWLPMVPGIVAMYMLYKETRDKRGASSGIHPWGSPSVTHENHLNEPESEA
jgi:hypothetical protein